MPVLWCGFTGFEHGVTAENQAIPEQLVRTIPSTIQEAGEGDAAIQTVVDATEVCSNSIINLQPL